MQVGNEEHNNDTTKQAAIHSVRSSNPHKNGHWSRQQQSIKEPELDALVTTIARLTGGQPNGDDIRITSSLNGLLSRLVKAYATLSRRRNDHMLLQTQTATEMSSYQHKRMFTEESILQLVATFSTQRREEMKNVGEGYFESIKSQVISDGEVLSAQTETSMDMESRSSSIQFLVNEAETTFMNALSDFVLGLPGGAALRTALDQAAVDAHEQVSEASEEMPEPANAYFDATGDSHILREQLLDLEQEHAKEKAQRELLRDQDNEPSTPDSTFEIRYEVEQTGLHERLNRALQRAKEAKAACDEQGIDVEALRHRKDSDSHDVEDAHPSARFQPFFVHSVGPDELFNMTPRIISADPDIKEPSGASGDNVLQWLTKGNAPSEDTRQGRIRRENQHTLRRYRSETALYIDR